MTATASAIKRLDDLFQNIRLDEQAKVASMSTSKKRSKEERVHFSPTVVVTKDCDIHGRKSYAGSSSNGRRISAFSTVNLNSGIGNSRGIGPRRESMPAGLNSASRKSPILPLASLSRETLVHPSAFSSTLRKDNVTASVGSLKRNSVLTPSTAKINRRNNLSGLSVPNVATAVANGVINGSIGRKDTTPASTNGFIGRRDYVNDSLSSSKKDSCRRVSSDSLDSFKRSSFDFNRRRNSSSGNSSIGLDDPIVIWEGDEENSKTTCRQDGDGQSNGGSSSATEANRPKFLPVTTLEDVQAVRCAEFHPRGTVYAIGSNSKILRICAYPNLTDLREDHTPCQPTVLFKRTRHHKGSIYCMSWTPDGDLLATGSNDKTVKLMRFNIDTANLEGQEIELAMHDGTVRDVCFIEDTSNKSSLLISGGAGDCKIYVTDCATGQAFQALSGHSGPILTLHNWGGAVFASGSQDRTVRFWDLRARGCTNIITPITSPANRQGSPVAAICVDPSGRLLVSGHEDSACVLYDIRGSRTLQSFRPHTSDVRSIRFSPSAYYLLTAGYDNKLVLTDLQGDLTASLPSVVVAQHQDKVISGRWHPAEFSFLSSSADKTATLWALPPA